MITTKYKIKDIEKLINVYGIEEINELSLIADKLRVVYTTLGWTHMTKDFFKADEIVTDLTKDCLCYLRDGVEEPSISSAGLKVAAYDDCDGFINLEYYFCL